jgi:hypothetical protein
METLKLVTKIVFVLSLGFISACGKSGDSSGNSAGNSSGNASGGANTGSSQDPHCTTPVIPNDAVLAFKMGFQWKNKGGCE